MTDLAQLRERVAGLTGPDLEMDYAITSAFWPPPQQPFEGAWPVTDDYRPRVTASIDAALALVERVLPRYLVTLNTHPLTQCCLQPLDVPGRGAAIAAHRTLPISILVAMLDVKLSQDTTP